MIVSKYISDHYTLPLYLPQVCIYLRTKFKILFMVWDSVWFVAHGYPSTSLSLFQSSLTFFFLPVSEMYHTLNSVPLNVLYFLMGTLPLPESSIPFYRSQLKCQILSSKRRASYLQGNFHKTTSWLLSRNFEGQKGVAPCIQSSERKKTYNQEYPASLSFRIEVEVKNFTGKQKFKSSAPLNWP